MELWGMEMESGSSQVFPGTTSDLGSSACLRESTKLIITILIFTPIQPSNWYKQFCNQSL